VGLVGPVEDLGEGAAGLSGGEEEVDVVAEEGFEQAAVVVGKWLARGGGCEGALVGLKGGVGDGRGGDHDGSLTWPRAVSREEVGKSTIVRTNVADGSASACGAEG